MLRLCEAVSSLLAAWVAFSLLRSPCGRVEKDSSEPSLPFFARLLDFYTIACVRPGEDVEMHAVIADRDLRFTLAVALAIAGAEIARRLSSFVASAGRDAARGGNELGRGLAILAVALACSRGDRTAEQARTDAAGAVLGGHCSLELAAVAKSASSTAALGPYTHPEKSVSVRYIWDASYDGVRSEEKTTC